MVKETNIRQGFLSDESYELLLNELPPELKALFATWYMCGLRKSELYEVQWPQVDWEAEEIILEEGDTKGKEARTVPIFRGDMWDLLHKAWVERNEKWPESPWVFSRSGQQIKDCRTACFPPPTS
jgi:integrase